MFGSIDVNRYVLRFKESLVCAVCRPRPPILPQWSPSWWTKGWRACTSTCLALIGALISSARPVRRSRVQKEWKKIEEKKRRSCSLKFMAHKIRHSHTALHKQPHIVCTHLCLAKINISLSDLGLENDCNKTKTTTSTCSQLLSPCDHSTSSTLLRRAPCAALVVVIAAHLCVCVSGCLPLCYTTSCLLREAHCQRYCVTL